MATFMVMASFSTPLLVANFNGLLLKEDASLLAKSTIANIGYCGEYRYTNSVTARGCTAAYTAEKFPAVSGISSAKSRSYKL